MAKPKLVHIFHGVVILRADRNSSGIRWTARTNKGDRLRADTLANIRTLIRRASQN